MILVRTHQEVDASTRRIPAGYGLEATAESLPGAGFSRTNYFGVTAMDGGQRPRDAGPIYPVAYRIEQDPHTTVTPHFHQANQFQVFIEGEGRFGKHPIEPGTIHYAGAYTPYGPIVAGTEGLRYFTLRDDWEPGGQFMPASRALLKEKGGRPRAFFSDALDAEQEHAALDARSQPLAVQVLRDGDDGLAAWRYRVPPQKRIVGPHPNTGGGQFWIVLAGSDVNAEPALAPLTCFFLSADEPAHLATAGAAGLDVLALQFPRR